MKKQISDNLVETITCFGDYVESQDGNRLFIDNLGQVIEDTITSVKIFFPEIFLAVGCEKAMIFSGAEQIIDRGLKDGMSRKKYYKDIYKDVRSKVELFAELHGKSEVISKQLSID